MENQTFDELTKMFGAGTTRRSLAKGVAGGVLGLVGLARLQRGAAAGASGTCPNGKDSSCPSGCKCGPNKTCFTCPDRSQPTLDGKCRCTARPETCEQLFGSRSKSTVPRIECA